MSAHNRANGSRFLSFRNARRELSIFQQTAESHLRSMLRRFRVDLLIGAPTDLFRVREVSKRNGLVFGIFQNGHCSEKILSGVVAERARAPIISFERFDAAVARHVHHFEQIGAMLERAGDKARAQ